MKTKTMYVCVYVAWSFLGISFTTVVFQTKQSNSVILGGYFLFLWRDYYQWRLPFGYEANKWVKDTFHKIFYSFPAPGDTSECTVRFLYKGHIGDGCSRKVLVLMQNKEKIENIK